MRPRRTSASSARPSTGTAPIGTRRTWNAPSKACARGRRKRTATTWKRFAWPRISTSSEGSRAAKLFFTNKANFDVATARGIGLSAEAVFLKRKQPVEGAIIGALEAVFLAPINVQHLVFVEVVLMSPAKLVLVLHPFEKGEFLEA